MKPLNEEKGSFSVAFLRRDLPFSSFPSLNYSSGFILYPHLQTPPDKQRYPVYCAFPLDAQTDHRIDHGCGISDEDRNATSDFCNRQNISTFDEWEKHFKLLEDEDFVRRQCGFNTSGGDTEAAKNFAVALHAKRYLQITKKYALLNNEIKVQAWNETEASRIPIEAFFYILDSPSGIEQAKSFRADFLAASGTWVPIIGICLPKSVNGNICDLSFEPYIE